MDLHDMLPLDINIHWREFEVVMLLVYVEFFLHRRHAGEFRERLIPRTGDVITIDDATSGFKVDIFHAWEFKWVFKGILELIRLINRDKEV